MKPEVYENEKNYDCQYQMGSFYEGMVKDQNKKKPKYSEPGEAMDPMSNMKDPHRNTQVGP